MEMIIALNNKSNLDKEQFLAYQEKLSSITTNHQMILCPTNLNINLHHISNVELGAQNVNTKEDGAYTGEVSARQLKASGVKYCIVGHSERREYQKETNEEINQKIKELIANDITPILCVEETKEQRENNQVEEVLKEELVVGTEGLEANQKIIIAYEPIWSIGTGLIPTVEEIDKVLAFIKTIYPNSNLLYGGSANEKNIDQLKASSYIEGYLLGGLSLKPEELTIFVNKL